MFLKHVEEDNNEGVVIAGESFGELEERSELKSLEHLFSHAEQVVVFMGYCFNIVVGNTVFLDS